MPKITPQVGILGGTFLFITSIAICTILVPLRMLELGFSLPQIGVVAATAAMISLLGQLPGGAFCDRSGQRLPLVLSFLSLSFVGLGMIISNTLLLFVISMVFRGFSGALYFPASQSYASLLDPPRAAVILGRQTSAIAIASIAGALTAGYVASFFGFITAFAISAVLAFLGLVLTMLTPKLPETDAQKTPQPFRVILKNARFLLSTSRTLQLALFCAFLAAIPFALNGSFYPVYYVSLGYDERMVGILSALLNITVFITGLAFGYLNKRFHFRIIIIASLLGTGLSMVFLAWSTSLFLIIPVIMLQGLVLGLAAVMSVFLASEAAGAGERGISIGVMEMGFSGALFLIPLSFGFALERIEYGTAFLILGTFLIFFGVLFKTTIRRSALNQPMQKRKVSA